MGKMFGIWIVLLLVIALLSGGGYLIYKQRSNSPVTPITRPSDTTKPTRVVRIKLSNTLGERFKNYDSTNAYKSDSAFKANFRGLAIKADNIGNSLSYFDFSDNVKRR